MTSIADFVGTWYFRGDRKRPCYIRLKGAKLEITDEFQHTFPAHLQGDNAFVTENPSNWGLRGDLSSDSRRIAWSNGESWER